MISAEWARIILIRKAVTCAVSAAFEDVGLSHELAMVSAELLENAVKYGTDGTLHFEMKMEGNDVVIRVSNAVEGDSGAGQKLRLRLAWIRGFTDPDEAYVAALNQIAESTDAERTSSGLGLIRIVSEGGCTLECDDSKPGQVAVFARRRLADVLPGPVAS